MSNPFNRPEFRNEALIGDAYRTVEKVHQHLDELLLLASRFHEVRSGNIELALDANWDLKYKYLRGEEWFVIGNLTTLVEAVSGDMDALRQALNSTDIQVNEIIGELVTVNTSISDNALAVANLADEVTNYKGTNDVAVNGLTQELATTNQTLSTANTDIDTLTQELATEKDKVTALESLVASLTSRVEALESPAP